MIATNQDITDLVTVTVKNLGGDANDVQLNGDNILIGSVPVSIASFRACSNSTKAFLSLIKKALRL